jgi:hypothetical protein
MGIRLDWEIESERERVQTVRDDQQAARQRLRAFRRLLLFTLLLIGIGCALVAVVAWRLDVVDQQIRQNLITTVENEVAALRIGDRSAFTNIQRSDSDVWLQGQQQLYDTYQTLKSSAQVTLSGRTLDVAIDGPRGRVLVEEIIDGVAFSRLWFYWRYDDGWRHVPPDYTFWGDARLREDGGVTVRYWAVDEPLAQSLILTLPGWLRQGCAALACAEPPPLVVDIVPDEALSPGFAAADSWQMRIPSPYLRPVQMNAVWTPESRATAADLIAGRLLSHAAPASAPAYASDGAYLRDAVQAWLTERFTGGETMSYTIASLAERYGEPAIGRLLSALVTDSSLNVLATAAGVASAADLEIDWRSFLTWRLALEAELIAARDEANFPALYDLDDPAVGNVAFGRYAAGSLGETWLVNGVTREQDASGVPILRADAAVWVEGVGVRNEMVVFRLVGGTWRRAS